MLQKILNLFLKTYNFYYLEHTQNSQRKDQVKMLWRENKHVNTLFTVISLIKTILKKTYFICIYLSKNIINHNVY